MTNPAAEKLLKRQITEGKVQLVKQESMEPAFVRQMSKIGEKGFEAAALQTEDEADSQLDAGLDPEDCEIDIEEEAKLELVNTVAELVN